MTAVDTSALVAIVRNEAERGEFNRLISAAGTVIGAPTLVELSLVLSGTADDDTSDDDLATLVGRIEVVPFSTEMSVSAQAAFRRFGRGRNPARLNFGDCMSYAVAKVMGLPLLLKGSDCALTDLRPAWTP